MAVTVTVAINTNDFDTSGRRESATGWANIASSTYTDNPDSTPSVLGLSKGDWGGTNFGSSVVYLRFDTGAVLPPNAVVISANLLVYILAKQEPGGVGENYAADFYDYGGSPSIAADWEVSSSGNAIAGFNTNDLTASTVETIPLTGLTGITGAGEVNAQGFTDITGIRLSAQTSTEPTVDNWVDFAAYEHASQEPRLEVTYILPGDCRAADIFDRADGNLTTPYETFADWDAMQIISNTVWGDGEPSGSIYTGATFDDDQWADSWIVQTDGIANSGPGLMLRASDSAENCYVALASASGTIYIGKYLAGSYTALANFAASFVDNDRLRFEAEGTTLRVYRNQVLYGETTDSDITGGYPGMCRVNTSAVNHGNFFAGNLHSSPSIVGIAEMDSLYSTGTGTVIVPPDAEFAVAMYSNWDSTPDTIDYVRLDGDDFTPQLLTPPVGSMTGTGILTLDTLPAPGPYDLTWGWLAGANQDEGGRIIVVFLKDLHATSLFRDVGTAVGTTAVGANSVVTVSLATAPGDFVLGMTQKFASNPAPRTYALIDGVSPYNSEHFELGLGAAGSGISTSIQSGDPEYNTQAFISFPAQSQEEDVVTLPIAIADDDGTGEYNRAGGGWPPSSGGVWTDNSNAIYESAVKMDQGGSNSTGQIACLRFDTSFLPDDAVIQSALLQMFVTFVEDANNTSVVADYYDFGGEPTVAADFIETASPSIFTAVDLGAITVGAVNSFPLTDLTGISKTGYTGIRFTLSSYTPNFNYDQVQFAAFEHTVYQAPRLTVVYSEAEEAVPLMWHTAIV